ncbi:MAG: tRNA uridine-5-carboxymethylaminomethyl(34) synthesis GTPase MnmE [Thermodesulfobacteriota bacterium]
MSRSGILDSDTIAAISTPPGAGGIGIIRMSGNSSLVVLKQLFSPTDTGCTFSSHRFYHGHIVDPEGGKILDEVLAVYMQSPKSYTREDVVEIHCHGSFLVLQSILELLLHCDVRLADAGEFTKRAFLNGRIDLTRAEAVIDILAARTRKGVDLALDQLGGSLFRRVDRIRQVLVEMRALIEVAIDFPDEDIEIVNHQELSSRLNLEVREPLQELIDSAEQGKIIRDGISVVIVGLPNVGKSSLLNTILQEERALVTAIPGTTRDTIEEYVDIHGIPVRMVDTAGIRDGAEEVEEMGIRRARNQIDQADLVLFMVDRSQPLAKDDLDLFETIRHKQVVLVANKCDLADGAGQQLEELSEKCLGTVRISAKAQQGIEDLRQTIYNLVTGGKDQFEEAACAPNIRHKQSLIRALAAGDLLFDGLSQSLTSDLLAVDLQECVDQLDEIVGVTTTEDVLDVIFEQFCLGK